MVVAVSRDGIPLKISSREVGFSYWPAKKVTTKYSMQARVFASDPFNIIKTSISQSDAADRRKKEALAYFDQARDFYQASKFANIENAKPLLVYYSFHNLIKCLLLVRGRYTSIADSHHGLSLNFDTLGNKPTTSKMFGFKSIVGRPPNLFEDFYKEFHADGFDDGRIEFSMSDMFSQILVGHRLWCIAASKKERFINISEIEFLQSVAKDSIWAKMNLPKSEYKRLSYNQRDLLDLTYLSDDWRIVQCNEFRNTSLKENNSELISLELLNPIQTRLPSQRINALSKTISENLWTSVSTQKPFRKHYIYLAEDYYTWPQVCSIYGVFFYLGSLARYRPQKLKQFLGGPFGSFISEFIENQTDQWLYLMASEFAEQEVAKAAIV